MKLGTIKAIITKEGAVTLFILKNANRLIASLERQPQFLGSI